MFLIIGTQYINSLYNNKYTYLHIYTSVSLLHFETMCMYAVMAACSQQKDFYIKPCYIFPAPFPAIHNRGRQCDIRVPKDGGWGALLLRFPVCAHLKIVLCTTPCM